MVRKIEVDADELVKIMRDAAEEHGWCEVAEDLLAKAGLIQDEVYSGFITIKVPIESVRVPAEARDDVSAWARKYFGASVFVEASDASREFYDDSINIDSADLKPGTGNESGERNWLYTSDVGRVLHHYEDREINKAWGERRTSCGTYLWGVPTKTSTQGQNRKCARCVAKTS